MQPLASSSHYPSSMLTCHLSSIHHGFPEVVTGTVYRSTVHMSEREGLREAEIAFTSILRGEQQTRLHARSEI